MDYGRHTFPYPTKLSSIAIVSCESGVLQGVIHSSVPFLLFFNDQSTNLNPLLIFFPHSPAPVLIIAPASLLYYQISNSNAYSPEDITFMLPSGCKTLLSMSRKNSFSSNSIFNLSCGSPRGSPVSSLIYWSP